MSVFETLLILLKGWKIMSQHKSDMQKFIELYKSFGIDLFSTKTTTTDGNYNVSLSKNMSDKFGGYSGFISVVVFDKDGKFIEQGFYE